MGCRIWRAHPCRPRRCSWDAWRRKEAANQLGRQISHVYETWMLDCKSLEEHLIAPTMGNPEDKRSSVDFGSLRQDIWTNGMGEVEIRHPRKFGHKIRWVADEE
eukprot:338967-Pyramimonas_sp.AAC.1